MFEQYHRYKNNKRTGILKKIFHAFFSSRHPTFYSDSSPKTVSNMASFSRLVSDLSANRIRFEILLLLPLKGKQPKICLWGKKGLPEVYTIHDIKLFKREKKTRFPTRASPRRNQLKIRTFRQILMGRPDESKYQR